jgi:hypothetical protein
VGAPGPEAARRVDAGGRGRGRLGRLRPRGRRVPSPVQPRPQRRLARAPLARAKPPRRGDGGAVHVAVPPRHRPRLPPHPPVRRGGAPPGAQPRPDARAAGGGPPGGARDQGPAVGGRPPRRLAARAGGHDQPRRPGPAAADGRRVPGPGGRGVRRRPFRHRAGGRRQRRVPLAPAGGPHRGRREGPAVGVRDPARALSPPRGAELLLDPRVLRPGGDAAG